MPLDRNQILLGDCLDLLPTLPAGFVQCCVTSPPYWGLRDYGTRRWYDGDPGCNHDRGVQHKPLHPGQVEQTKAPKRTDYSGASAGGTALTHSCSKCGAWWGQVGLEPNPDDYVRHLVEIFSQVRRILRDDGTLFLNLGDTYKGTGANAPKLKTKDLTGIPWMVALALRQDGWYLRSEIIWHKTVALPESAKDRPTRNHEHVFLLSKSEHYYYNSEAVQERAVDGYRNRRTVWSLTTSGASDGHFATFPEELPLLCTRAGTSRRGACAACGKPRDAQTGARGCRCKVDEHARSIVFDPFTGSGTTLLAGVGVDCDYLGCEINETYAEIARGRLQAAMSLRGQRETSAMREVLEQGSADDRKRR